MADIAKLVEDLSKLTVLEAADLAKALEEAWGVSAAAAVAVAGPAAEAGPAVEEQTASFQEVSSNINSINDMAHDLTNIVSRFKI